MLDLSHFLTALTPSYQPTGREPVLSAVVIDSREAGPGSLFVALPGEKVDGHDYVQDAFARGAIAALVERPPQLPGDCLLVDTRAGTGLEALSSASTPVCLVVDNALAALQTSAKAWRARFPVRVVGITGSVGKTSTKELTHAVLSRHYSTLKSPGNRNSVIGLPPALFELRPHHEYAVLEMGMYVPGEIAALCEMAQPVVGVVTMIGPVHLERAGSMAAIVAAKQELVEALPAEGTAVLNRDDRQVMGMARYTQARVFTYGLNSNADLWADNIRSMGLDGIRFTLRHGQESLSLRVPLLGMGWEEIVAGLSHMSAQLRLVAAPGPSDSLIIDDTYNSSPDSALAALNLLKDLDGRHVAVLGDMLELGHMEEASHRLVGRRAADVADVLVAVGPRGRWIGEEALMVGMSPQQVFLAPDVETAVSILEELIREKDVLLIKGSLGMRMDRIVAALGRDS
jgi:UDP-N-acetylmuramoyl-tripeptide--D-alanyl-D-alanine ligase